MEYLISATITGVEIENPAKRVKPLRLKGMITTTKKRMSKDAVESIFKKRVFLKVAGNLPELSLTVSKIEIKPYKLDFVINAERQPSNE